MVSSIWKWDQGSEMISRIWKDSVWRNDLRSLSQCVLQLITDYRKRQRAFILARGGIENGDANNFDLYLFEKKIELAKENLFR